LVYFSWFEILSQIDEEFRISPIFSYEDGEKATESNQVENHSMTFKSQFDRIKADLI